MNYNEEYGGLLPSGLKIEIVNPNGMIIMRRDKNLTSTQKNDFEIIRKNAGTFLKS